MPTRRLFLSAAILAGGKSSRMGADKTAIVWRGESLLVRTARICREAGLPVTVVGRERPTGWPLVGVRFEPDEVPDRGPLGGLLTALSALEAEYDGILAVACDMPLLDRSAVEWMCESASNAGNGIAGIAAKTGDGRVQPLFAVYLRACEPVIRSRIEQGRHSVNRMIIEERFEIVDAPSSVEDVIVNVNTPEDLAAVANRNGSAT